MSEEQQAEETTPQEEVEVMADEAEETAVSEDFPAESEEEKEPTLEEQLEAAKEEAAKNLDGWMRSQAEFANARKRMEKQRVDIQVRATTDMATRLLPVIDDFERALANVPEAISEDSWFAGVEMVNRKLIGILESLNVVPIEAVGEAFDPNCHEAIMQEESDEYESGVVTEELQKGYKIGDRVVRPSLVKVAA
ncbi:MAG: nucleotide exchange factor GrpE [Chloroflexi bacterium]|nr:MAG: nucleotide exchange factor GrpE [Chloroflexota bacterium]